MWRVIILTLLSLTLFVGFLTVSYYTGKQVAAQEAKGFGYLGKRGSGLAERANRIMGELGVTASLEDVEIISTVHKQAIEKWLDDYKNWRG
jgi:hypothetical protein